MVWGQYVDLRCDAAEEGDRGGEDIILEAISFVAASPGVPRQNDPYLMRLPDYLRVPFRPDLISDPLHIPLETLEPFRARDHMDGRDSACSVVRMVQPVSFKNIDWCK